jgi:hypothetical protein
MLYIAPHVCSVYSTFYSRQPPSSAPVPAAHEGRALHFLTFYAVDLGVCPGPALMRALLNLRRHPRFPLIGNKLTKFAPFSRLAQYVPVFGAGGIILRIDSRHRFATPSHSGDMFYSRGHLRSIPVEPPLIARDPQHLD